MIESITSFLAGDGGLWALCVSAFLSSTVLPGSSEALLAAALASAPQTDRALLLVAAASLFNTLGSMTSWAIGRYVPHRVRQTTPSIVCAVGVPRDWRWPGYPSSEMCCRSPPGGYASVSGRLFFGQQQARPLVIRSWPWHFWEFSNRLYLCSAAILCASSESGRSST